MGRHPGTEHPRRHGGGDGVRPHPTEVLRRDDGEPPLLARPGPNSFQRRLLPVASEVGHRRLPELRTSRGPEEGVRRRPQDGNQEEDPRGKRCQGVGHRHRGAEEETQERRAHEETPPSARDDPRRRGGEEGTAPRSVVEPRRSRCKMAQEAQADLKGSVLRALSTVTDPELDEPITDLGFVKELSVSDEGRVSLDLVTSTFWCSPNFVYMMLEEARDVVAKLDGITEVRVHLEGHHDSERINGGVQVRQSLSEFDPTEESRNIQKITLIIRPRGLRSLLSSM